MKNIILFVFSLYLILTYSHSTIQKHHLPYMKIESSLIWGYHTHLCIFLRKDQHKIPYGSIFSHYSTDSNISVFLLSSSIVHKEKKSSKAVISIFVDWYKCKVFTISNDSIIFKVIIKRTTNSISSFTNLEKYGH